MWPAARPAHQAAAIGPAEEDTVRRCMHALAVTALAGAEAAHGADGVPSRLLAGPTAGGGGGGRSSEEGWLVWGEEPGVSCSLFNESGMA